MQRRDFLGKLAGMSLLAVMPTACSIQSKQPVRYVSAAKDQQGFAVFGMDTEQNIQWRFALPERAHAATLSPDGSSVIITGRRPSTQAWLLETATGKMIRHINSKPNRHFFGHTVFDPTGRYIYSTENNTQTFDGLVVVRDLYKDAKVVNEFLSGGIGPHELLFMPDNKTLAVANGGIKTSAGSREKLNLDTMQPNLAYVDAQTGQIIHTIKPAHHHMSVRHMAVRQDGLVGIGVQFQGDKTQNIPLILTHQIGQEAFTPVSIPENDWLIFNQYIGSVAINNTTNQLCATSPRGNCVAVVDLGSEDRISYIHHLPDGCGVVATQDAHYPFTLSDGFGQTSMYSVSHIQRQKIPHEGIKWDNHMTGVFSY